MGIRRHVGVAEEFDLNELYINLYGYVAPPFPTLGLKEQLSLVNPLGLIGSLENQYKKTAINTEILMPLSISVPGEAVWEVPTEPMISIKGGHKIIRRYPNRSQQGGSIKERWSSDDYVITIKGVLIDLKEDKYPEEHVKRLRDVCEHKGSVAVENQLLQVFGIKKMVIKDYNVPFTQGLNVQAYSITAWSDRLFDNLLIKN